MLSQLPFVVAESAGSFIRAGSSFQKNIPSCGSFTTICENCFLWTVCTCGNIHYTCQIFIRKELHFRRRGTFWVYLYLCKLPKAHKIPFFNLELVHATYIVCDLERMANVTLVVNLFNVACMFFPSLFEGLVIL